MRDWQRDVAEAVIRHYSLTAKMVGALESGHPSNHSARVIGHGGSIKALQRRGLVGADRRWTARGFWVAERVVYGVKGLDEIHAQALEEDAGRRPMLLPKN